MQEGCRLLGDGGVGRSGGKGAVEKFFHLVDHRMGNDFKTFR